MPSAVRLRHPGKPRKAASSGASEHLIAPSPAPPRDRHPPDRHRARAGHRPHGFMAGKPGAGTVVALHEPPAVAADGHSAPSPPHRRAPTDFGGYGSRPVSRPRPHRKGGPPSTPPTTPPGTTRHPTLESPPPPPSDGPHYRRHQAQRCPLLPVHPPILSPRLPRRESDVANPAHYIDPR